MTKLLERTRLPEGYSLSVSYDATGAIKASVKSTYHELLLTSLVVAVIIPALFGETEYRLHGNPCHSHRAFGGSGPLQAPGIHLQTWSPSWPSSARSASSWTTPSSSRKTWSAIESWGFSLKESVLKGASEVFSAVVAASLTLLSVLIPVSFIGGFVGRYIQQFALGLAAAVAFSLFEALLFLTVRMAYTPEAKTFDWKDLGKSLGMLRSSLSWGLGAWKKALGIVFGLAIAGFLVYPEILFSSAAPLPLSLRLGSRFLCSPYRHDFPAVSYHDASRVDRGLHRLGSGRLCAHASGHH